MTLKQYIQQTLADLRRVVTEGIDPEDVYSAAEEMLATAEGTADLHLITMAKALVDSLRQAISITHTSADRDTATLLQAASEALSQLKGPNARLSHNHYLIFALPRVVTDSAQQVAPQKAIPAANDRSNGPK